MKNNEKITNILLNKHGYFLTIIEKKSSTEIFITDEHGNDKNITSMIDDLCK